MESLEDDVVTSILERLIVDEDGLILMANPLADRVLSGRERSNDGGDEVCSEHPLRIVNLDSLVINLQNARQNRESRQSRWFVDV